jgi:hypothetical protein
MDEYENRFSTLEKKILRFIVVGIEDPEKIRSLSFFVPFNCTGT